MSAGGRARARGQLRQRTGLVAGALVLLTVLLAAAGHWVLTIILGVAAVVAVWVFVQARDLR
jgi:hypothetical protein